MAKTLGDLHPAYIRKYTIATLIILMVVAAIRSIARREQASDDEHVFEKRLNWLELLRQGRTVTA
jgi:hypothetical protein